MNPLNTLPVDQGILLEWYQDLLTARMLDQHLSSISNATSFQGGELVPLICTEPLDPARDRYFPHGVSTATALARGVSAPNLMAGYLDRARWNPPPDEDRLVDQAIHAGAGDDGVTVVSLPDGPVLRTLTERGADSAIVVVVSSDSGADRHSDAVHVDGSNAIALVTAIREAVERTRRDRKLTTVVAMVAQIDGRRGPDGAEELGMWRQKDPLRNLRQLMIEERILSEEQEAEITRRAEEATMVASASSRRAATAQGAGVEDRRSPGSPQRHDPALRETDPEHEASTDEAAGVPVQSESGELVEAPAVVPDSQTEGLKTAHPAGSISMVDAASSMTETRLSEDSDAATDDSEAPSDLEGPRLEDEGPGIPERESHLQPRPGVGQPIESTRPAKPEDVEIVSQDASTRQPPGDEIEPEPPIETAPPVTDRSGQLPQTPIAFDPPVAADQTSDSAVTLDQSAITMDSSISMAGMQGIQSDDEQSEDEPHVLEPSESVPQTAIPRHPAREAPESVAGPVEESEHRTPDGPDSTAADEPRYTSGPGTVKIQSGDELTVVFIGMEPAGIRIPGGDVVSVHRLSPLDLGPIVESIKRTSKPLLVTTPVTRSIGDNIAAHISEKLEEWLDSDVEHITVANPMTGASTIVKAASDLAEY